MVYFLIVPVFLGILVEKIALRNEKPRLNFPLKLLLVLSISALMIAYQLQAYLSTKDTNIYEKLGIGRMMPVKDLLYLIKSNKEYSDMYESVEKGIHELDCIYLSARDWLLESFTFYGGFLLVTNLISFYKPGISHSLLIVILGSLGIEFLIYIKQITLSMLIYTSCEQVKILRCIIPGFALCCYLICSIRYSNMIKVKQMYIDSIVASDVNAAEFQALMQTYNLSKHYELTSFLAKLIDYEAKATSQPSKTKKIVKYLAMVLIAYSLFSSNNR